MKLEDTSNSLKDEKQSRRRLEAQVKEMEDEITELKVEKESLEKVKAKLSTNKQIDGQTGG